MRRPALVGLLCTGLLLIGGPALAEDDVTSFDLRIAPLEENITPLETTATQGSTTMLTLSSDVLFDTGSAEISEAAAQRIGQLVSGVPQGAPVSVDGHTDDVPYDRGNDVLSQERAQAVADAIAAQRPDLVLTVTGHGQSRPVEPNSIGGSDNPEGRAKNRRVEISYGG